MCQILSINKVSYNIKGSQDQIETKWLKLWNNLFLAQTTSVYKLCSYVLILWLIKQKTDKQTTCQFTVSLTKVRTATCL